MKDKDRQLLYETYLSLLNEEMHDCIQDMIEVHGYSYAEAKEECKGSQWDDGEDKMEESRKSGIRFPDGDQEPDEDTIDSYPNTGRAPTVRKHSQALKAAEHERLVNQGRDVEHTGWTGEGYDELVADVMNGKMDKATMEQLTVDELVKIILIIRGNK